MEDQRGIRSRLSGRRDLPPDRRLRAHLVTTAILAGIILVLVLVWTRPIVLLWVLLAVVAVMAYAGIYLVVSSRLTEDEEEPRSRPGRHRLARPSRATPPAEATPQREPPTAAHARAAAEPEPAEQEAGADAEPTATDPASGEEPASAEDRERPGE